MWLSLGIMYNGSKEGNQVILFRGTGKAFKSGYLLEGEHSPVESMGRALWEGVVCSVQNLKECSTAHGFLSLT